MGHSSEDRPSGHLQVNENAAAVRRRGQYLNREFGIPSPLLNQWQRRLVDFQKLIQ